jgi:hypothetical protein
VDIVLPLVAADVDRYLRLQRPTFERFYEDLGTTWIVTRPEDVVSVRRNTFHLDGVEVIDERDVAPELALMPHRHEPDWSTQQLAKLAAVAAADAEFVLLTDADVIATHPFSDVDLVVRGRARRGTAPPDVRKVEWERQAGDVLGLIPLEYTASVTPSVLARDAVRLLAAHIAEHVEPSSRRMKALSLVPVLSRRALSWRGRLLGHKWTEYQLYDTFLVRTRRIHRWHFAGEVLYGNCVRVVR